MKPRFGPTTKVLAGVFVVSGVGAALAGAD